MPARDVFHKQVRTALEKDSWTITDDPLALSLGLRTIFVDLGAEKLIGAIKDGIRIAVETKSFLSQSIIKDIEEAIGQYQVYRFALQEEKSDYLLYLALPVRSFEVIRSEPVLVRLLESQQVRLLVFNPDKEVIEEWSPHYLQKSTGSE